uniref:Uncharacterized protein n=1 Tax=Arundo donax TaxID=35708 RepID=A0A0A8Z6W8_ARUDO
MITEHSQFTERVAYTFSRSAAVRCTAAATDAEVAEANTPNTSLT